MDRDNQIIAAGLVVAGIMPVWILLALKFWLPELALAPLALGYGAVIASFVCGVHWGLFMTRSRIMPVNLLVTSNVGALLAWAMLALGQGSAVSGFTGMALVLAGLLALDFWLLQRGGIAPWFWRLRWIATAGLGLGLLVWGVTA
ncbi:MAG: DUF3429 family protein [Devosia sp.]